MEIFIDLPALKDLLCGYCYPVSIPLRCVNSAEIVQKLTQHKVIKVWSEKNYSSSLIRVCFFDFRIKSPGSDRLGTGSVSNIIM